MTRTLLVAGEVLSWIAAAGERIWTLVTTPSPTPEPAVVAGLLAFALLVTAVTPVWRIARHLVTLVHEGGHGVAALVTGRCLHGIRLHSDTSGVTVSSGRPSGLGMIVTVFSGYTAPALFGLGAAWLLHGGYAYGVLWSMVALTGLLLLQIRNWFGLWSVLVSAGALVLISWFAPEQAGVWAAYLLTWFLLLGSVRPVIELQRSRLRGRARDSDADQLGRLTRIPGIVWVGVFFAVAIGATLLAITWLLEPLLPFAG